MHVILYTYVQPSKLLYAFKISHVCNFVGKTDKFIIQLKFFVWDTVKPILTKYLPSSSLFTNNNIVFACMHWLMTTYKCIKEYYFNIFLSLNRCALYIINSCLHRSSRKHRKTHILTWILSTKHLFLSFYIFYYNVLHKSKNINNNARALPLLFRLFHYIIKRKRARSFNSISGKLRSSWTTFFLTVFYSFYSKFYLSAFLL